MATSTSKYTTPSGYNSSNSSIVDGQVFKGLTLLRIMSFYAIAITIVALCVIVLYMRDQREVEKRKQRRIVTKSSLNVLSDKTILADLVSKNQRKSPPSSPSQDHQSTSSSTVETETPTTNIELK